LKSEIRNPKSEGNPKPESRVEQTGQSATIRVSGFGFLSDFGIRTSGFAIADRAFKLLTLLMALSVFALIILIGIELAKGSHLALVKFGWRFLASSEWDPVNENFGALPFIFGTVVSSLIALIIAVPLSIATALFLTELAPQWIRQPLIIFIELLAAVPSVILGVWGIFVMVPWLRVHLFPALQSAFGFMPLFQGPIYGVSLLAGGIIIAIMIVPIITSVSREILRSVPGLQREAAYALGATRWEVTRIAVLSYAKKGLFGAVILGLGRALGETMAVTMVIGNVPQIAKSLFAPGYTLASVIANEFAEATTDSFLSALFEIGLVLLGVTILVNAIAQILLRTFAGPGVKPQQ
jgi:phosphate transport system permease protein